MDNVKQTINNIKLPSRWEKEGIEQPNKLAKENAIKVHEILLDKYNLEATWINWTVEEGIFLAYYSEDKSKMFSVETYNDGNICALVNNQIEKEVIICEEITDFDFNEVILKFKT